MKNTQLLILSSLFLHCFSFAQKDFKNAEKKFQQGQFFNAIELYKNAYTEAKTEEDKALISFKTGECFRFIGDNKQSEDWYSKAIISNYTDPKAILYLAETKKAQGKYQEAIEEYNKYKSMVTSDTRGADGILSCELAQKWQNNPTRYSVENITLLNSEDPDFSPSYADNKYSRIYFTSMRSGVTGSEINESTGKNYGDVFETQMDKSGNWSSPVALPEPVNTKDNEGLTSATKKADMLFFTRSDQTISQIWLTTKKGNVWGEPEKLNFCVESLKYSSPSISSDGGTLFFVSDMPGGQGENDIWISKYDKSNKKWGDPINLGTEINTSGNDVSPFIQEEGTLYFSSNGYLGMGGLDIFKAEKKGEDQWGNVTNMKYPINSAGNDFGIVFEGKKEKGYLTSNREGTHGADDIWSFVLQPPLLFTIDGVITDCSNKEPITGVSVKLIGSDGSSEIIKTDAAGYYKFAENVSEGRYIKANTAYVISIVNDASLKTSKNTEGFLNNKTLVKQTTVGVKESRNFKHDFCLSPNTPKVTTPKK
ncbi:MAG: hypothetical protein A3F72_14790 [Bacteroidetes bacterium RIFCSPLOWO2_12_FULL_35_15]|nr:MAG: hypothetical protein A3F72_14790 [Bacteroidetes bacterium RIFCSPLOWO2_12_FULL_35_15]